MRLTIGLTAIFCLTSCVAPLTHREISRELMLHPQAEDAKKAAPEFVRAALKAIAKLEYELDVATSP